MAYGLKVSSCHPLKFDIFSCKLTKILKCENCNSIYVKFYEKEGRWMWTVVKKKNKKNGDILCVRFTTKKGIF